MYQMDLMIQQMEMKMIQMDMCMEMNQHMLDIGKCEGREESCFTSMVSCVNFNDISSWTSQLTSIISSGNNALAGMNAALQNVGTVTFGWGTGSYATRVWVKCGSESKSSCCDMVWSGSYSSSSPPKKNCQRQDIRLGVQNLDCKYPAIARKTGSDNYIWFCVGTGCDGRAISTTTQTQNVEMKFRFYCFPDVNTANSKDAVEGKPVTDQLASSYCLGGCPEYTFSYQHYDETTDSNCQCTGGGNTNSGCCQWIDSFDPTASTCHPAQSISDCTGEEQFKPGTTCQSNTCK
jgi:hypothetical protein